MVVTKIIDSVCSNICYATNAQLVEMLNSYHNAISCRNYIWCFHENFALPGPE